LEDLVSDGRMKLKQILKIWNGIEKTKYIWISIGTGGGVLKKAINLRVS
jgi:hypothetical protein